MRPEPQRKHSFQVVPPADGWNDLPETALWVANNADNSGTSAVGNARRIPSRHRYQVTSPCDMLAGGSGGGGACRQDRPPLSRPPSSFTKPSLSQTPGSASQTSLSSLDSDGFVLVPKDSNGSSKPGISPSSDSLCMGLSQILTIPSNLPQHQLTHCASKLETILSCQDLSSHHREAVALVFNSLLANHDDDINNSSPSSIERQTQAKKILMQHMLSNPDSASWATALRRLVEGIKA